MHNIVIRNLIQKFYKETIIILRAHHLKALLNILETRPKGGRLLVLLINYTAKKITFQH